MRRVAIQLLPVFLCSVSSPGAATPADASAVAFDGLPASWTAERDTLTAGGGDYALHAAIDDRRVHLEYFRHRERTAAAVLRVAGDETIPLDGAPEQWHSLDVTCETPLFHVRHQGRDQPLTLPAAPCRLVLSAGRSRNELRMDDDFTLLVNFRSRKNGTLAAMAPATGPWAADAKALFLRGGRLVYDIGWLGEYSDGPTVTDGARHTAGVTLQSGTATLYVDGKAMPPRRGFTRPDAADHVFKIGTAAPDFGGDFSGEIAGVRFYRRALTDAEVAQWTGRHAGVANTPDFEWKPPGASAALTLRADAGVRFRNVWTQRLDFADHAAIIRAWDAASLERGRAIYAGLCVICHGTLESPGSLPTALRFGEGPFKNGGDPRSIFNTLTNGFGQMVAQPQYTARQKYDVIHYITETFRSKNSSAFPPIDAAYLERLPMGRRSEPEEAEILHAPKYEQMDFGPALFWTLQAADGNIAQKGIAVRLDDGAGGVSKGHAWMLYDHDTMRMAAAWTGDKFVDWRGIAFDGSHQTHTGISGARVFVNPASPGWADPDKGGWEDARVRGRDGKPYGPLPRAWAHYRGLYLHGTRVVVKYSVGDTEVLDSPGLIPYGSTPVFTRTLNIGRAGRALTMRVAPDDPSLSVSVSGGGAQLERAGGFVLLRVPADERARSLRIYLSRLEAANLTALQNADSVPLDLAPLTQGGPARWSGETVTNVVPGDASGAFLVDALTPPDANPWRSWMRLTGFDFYPGGKSAAVSTWNGDVWRVDGIDGSGELRWRRLVSGLFQPLGVKFRDDDLFICCRDQLARLRDLNGDGETDYIESFNNDHQVTEHFHEFAMGLQSDAAGNFYYAKSARHALPAVVPHHGTLLRVTADGSRTDILATGFRAANGVCLSPDGTFFVTDQEGHWTPKNRINHVVPDGGFYGNIFGYTAVTDTADTAMRQPLVWITNAKDRSPAELLRVPENTWGPLAGSLLNLSYGHGRIFIVPHEFAGGQIQGGVCELPVVDFPSGIMRGRFHPGGALYVCGMTGWATNCRADGGFYRVRPTGRPAHVPVAVRAGKAAIVLTFSDPVNRDIPPDAIRVKVWGLRRSANYGSPHVDEHPLEVRTATVAGDGKTLTLEIPALAPTPGMEIAWNLRGVSGEPVSGNLHLTIHSLEDRPAPLPRGANH